MRLGRVLAAVAIMAAACSSGGGSEAMPTSTSTSTSTVAPTTTVPTTTTDAYPAAELTIFGSAPVLEILQAVAPPADEWSWVIRGPGSLCGWDDPDPDKPIVEFRINRQGNCYDSFSVVATRAIYVYASEDVPELDLDILAIAYADPSLVSFRVGSPFEEDPAWNQFFESLDLIWPSLDQVDYFFSEPSSIRDYVGAGQSVTFSALPPSVVGLDPVCLVASVSPSDRCVGPENRDLYPLLEPIWFAANGEGIGELVLERLLSPEGLAAAELQGIEFVDRVAD